MIGHGTQYGTGSFEGGSVEPVVAPTENPDKYDIAGANLILAEPRMERLYNRSLPAMGIDLPIDREAYTQGIQDLVAVLGTGILVGEDGTIGRAYLRPSVAPGMGR